MRDDLISRKAAIDRIKRQMKRPDSFGLWAHDDKIAEVCYGIAIEILENLPSAEPERHGRWIDITNDESLDIELKCSECGFELINWLKMHYCPNCGAKMVGEQE